MYECRIRTLSYGQIWVAGGGLQVIYRLCLITTQNYQPVEVEQRS